MRRVRGTAYTSEQLGARDVELRPAGDPLVAAERVQDDETGRRALGHRDRDRPVRLDDRGRLVPDQLPVQRCDLPPVGLVRAGRAGVAGGDRGVQLVRPGPPRAQRPLKQQLAFGDLRAVPP